MTIIENFAELSEQEQRTFAEALMKTINSEHIFTGETDFKVLSVEADEMLGGLYIETTNTDPIEVRRKATWQAADEEDAYAEPSDANYKISVYAAVEASFKTKEAVIEGYEVSLHEVNYVDEEFDDVEIDNISYEDSGIGYYEFWGDVGYDSREYVEVKGTVIHNCTCGIYFYVEPVDEPANTEPEEDEED